MNEQLSSLLRRKEVIPASVGLVAFIGGGALGYILGQRRRAKTVVFETLPATSIAIQKNDDEEWGVVELGEPLGIVSIEETEDGIKWTTEPVITVKGEFFPNPAIARPSSVIKIVPPLEDEDDTGISVIEEPDDGEWDWEAEKSTRHAHEPYVIHLTEFDEDSFGYTQSQVNYYAGDDVLTDEHEKPVYGHSALLGELKFGHGSGDPSIVFIRNELLEHEYEVILNQGHYAVEVLGLEIDEKYSEQDLKHSKVQRFRMD